VLRYFQNKNLREVGSVFGLDEYAAQKVVSRALEKLRKFFTRRGVDSTAAVLAGEMSANSVQVVPVALVQSVAALAFVQGATASHSTSMLIEGALKMMAWAKAKSAAAAGAGPLLIIGTIVVVTATGYAHHLHAMAESDRTRPRITAFRVSPATTNFGHGFTITYTVSDSGGSHLNAVDLWRAHINGTDRDTSWAQVGPAVLLSGDGPVSGTFPVDVPAEPGNYWYGLHVTDHASNIRYEDQSGFVPIRATVVP